MPDSCCVVGCSNRRSKDSNIPFYTVPKGKSPLERKRREDWIKAISREDWKFWSEDQISKARVCGAHFVSGKFFCLNQTKYFCCILVKLQPY